MSIFFEKTDSKIQEDVISELQWDPSINARGIAVSSKKGIVTLRGSVPHFIEKVYAEHAAQRVSGVRAVADELEISFANPPNHKDEDIAEATLNAFKWNYSVPSGLQVAVEKGWVTISGKVDWDYQRNAAQNAASEILGVAGVTNNMSISSKAVPSNIRTRIEDALKRSAESEGRKISVSVVGDRVTLSGSVHSFSDKEDARLAAFNAPGVMTVENNLVIS